MQIIKKHFNTLHTHAKKHIEKLDAHVKKHAPTLHAHAKKAHAHLSKPAKHHHYWLALCGIILRSSIVTYTNSSFARQSLQNIVQFEGVSSIDIATSNLTGVYNSGDIIIDSMNFVNTSSTGSIGTVNTIIDNSSNATVKINLTIKNIGSEPIYIPPYYNNTSNIIGIMCFTNTSYNNINGFTVSIDPTNLTQQHYLLPSQTLNTSLNISAAYFGFDNPSQNNGRGWAGINQITCTIVTIHNLPSPVIGMYELLNFSNNNGYTIYYNEDNICNYNPRISGCTSNALCQINPTAEGCQHTTPFGDTLYIYKETKHIFRNQANAQAIANYPSCVCDQSAMDTASPHDCEFTNQTINNGNVGGTIGWTPTNAHYFYSNNVGDYCTDNHNAADGGIDIYQRYVAPQSTGNNGYGYGYGYGYTNNYGYGYGYGYRYAKGQYANSPIFYLTKPYLMISQSVWEQYKNINLLPTKMKKLAAGTIENLFDKKALIEIATELQTSFDRTKQKLETMKTAARSKVQSDYQKARKLFEDGYTALFKKKGVRNKETEQAIKRTSKSENTLTTQVLPSETIKSKTDNIKQPATANVSQSVQDQAIKAPATTKKDSFLKRIKDKMRQIIKDKLKQVKSN